MRGSVGDGLYRARDARQFHHKLASGRERVHPPWREVCICDEAHSTSHGPAACHILAVLRALAFLAGGSQSALCCAAD